MAVSFCLTDAIGYYNEDSVRGKNVRQAMFTYFKIPIVIPKAATKLKPLTQNAQDYLTRLQEYLMAGDVASIPPARTYFFCDSTWLTLKDPASQATDYAGNSIKDNGEAVAINAIPAYIKALRPNNVPWWSGDYTTPPLYGYIFALTSEGGNFCREADQNGVTTPIKLNGDEYVSVIICPDAFTNNNPASYAGTITTGTSLEDAVPKSATLLHEAMHVTFGSLFLTGSQEKYTLGELVDLAQLRQADARRNPESYVYFIAAMTYMFGDATVGVNTNINFVDNPVHAQACTATGATQCT